MRICTECGKKMNRGYCIFDGMEYYCSDECLHKHWVEAEYIELYNKNEAYWTEWEEDDEDV